MAILRNIPIRNDIVVVNTSSTTIAQAREQDKPPRQVIYVKNTSASGQAITIMLGSGTAKAGYGIVLEMGEYFVDSTDTNRECWQGEIQAIADYSGGQISIMEW